MTQVTEHLQAYGVPFEPIAHQQAYTSIDEARALGIEASEVLKTVAVRLGGGYALMAIPATGRLDMHLVQEAVGDRHVRLATEQELRRDFPGFELGALPPLGVAAGRTAVCRSGGARARNGGLCRGEPDPIRPAQNGGPAPARAGGGPAVDQACRRE